LAGNSFNSLLDSRIVDVGTNNCSTLLGAAKRSLTADS
jgi:hypothetical protein